MLIKRKSFAEDPGSCFQALLSRIPIGMWHCTTSPCSNEPLWVGSLLSTVAKGISAFSGTEDEHAALLNPVLIQFTTKRLEAEGLAPTLLAVASGCAQDALNPLLEPVCRSVGQIPLDFAVHPTADSGLLWWPHVLEVWTPQFHPFIALTPGAVPAPAGPRPSPAFPVSSPPGEMEALGSPSLFPSWSLPGDQGHILKPCHKYITITNISSPIPQGHFHAELMFLLLQINSCIIYLKLPKVFHFSSYPVTLLFCPSPREHARELQLQRLFLFLTFFF